MAGVVSLSTASGRHPSPHRPRSRRSRPPPYGSAWYQSALSLRRHPALAWSTLRDSISHEAGTCSTASPTTRRRAVATGQPASRQRPASSLPSRHARAREAPTARAAIRATPTSGSQVDCVFVDQLPFNRRQPQLPRRETVPEARHPRRLLPFIHVLAHVHRHRPPEPRQRRSRQRIPIVGRPRRFAVRQPPLRGARQRQRLLALVVRVVELRDIDPLRRLARQERHRAARRRVYRARAVTNSSSIPCLSRDCPLYVFRENLSIVVTSRRLPARVLLPVGILSRSYRRMLLAGVQDAFQSGKWPLYCLAPTAYGISTASGETDRHRRVRTAGRRRRTGHLVDLEQSRGPSAGQPKPHWTECVGSAGSPLVGERADQHVPPPVQPSHQSPRCPVPDTLGRWPSKTARRPVTSQAGGADGIWRLLKSAKPVTPRRPGCTTRA